MLKLIKSARMDDKSVFHNTTFSVFNCVAVITYHNAVCHFTFKHYSYLYRARCPIVVYAMPRAKDCLVYTVCN